MEASSTGVLRRVLRLAVLLLLLLGPTPSIAARLALVVGIDAYSHVPPLRKAVNDARSVAAALSRAGFETMLLTDVDQLALMQGITALTGRLQPGDEAIFFFAGHGLEIAGRNYLLPADVPSVAVGQELILTSRALEVGTLVQEVQMRGTRVTMLILDACRDNPFQRSGGRAIGGQRGLAKVEAPEGSFILFSAGTGQSALDRLSDNDPVPNSVFTRALLPYLGTPGMEVQDVSRRVRSEVRRLALTVQHDQFPAIYDQLDGSFVLTPATSSTPVPQPVAPLSQPADPCASARSEWELVSSGESPTALDVFAVSHADCPVLAAMARDLRARVVALPAAPDPAPRPEVALEERARSFVTRIVTEWSLPNEIVLPRLPQYFDDDLIYYGQRRTRAQVVAEKTSVAMRWPVRDYGIEDGSLRVACTGQQCQVSAVIIWQARAPDRSASASGRSSYEVTLAASNGVFVVTEENGHTLRRD